MEKKNLSLQCFLLCFLGCVSALHLFIFHVELSLSSLGFPFSLFQSSLKQLIYWYSSVFMYLLAQPLTHEPNSSWREPDISLALASWLGEPREPTGKGRAVVRDREPHGWECLMSQG